MSRADQIHEAVAALESRIATACARAGRARRDVLLVGVSKTFPASDVDFAIASGLTDLGENKVQEGRDKRATVSGSARWHLIGHLQSNKAKDAVRTFDVIQSVNSLDLALRMGRLSAEEGKTQEILLQVNVGREPQKSGAAPEETPELVRRMAEIPSLRLTGLMTIPPAGDPESSRPHFRELRALRDRLGLPHLSMGMTDDFEVAIEEGATIIRVGRAIFGTR